MVLESSRSGERTAVILTVLGNLDLEDYDTLFFSQYDKVSH